ncbi:MAG: EVE domain-containing protein [Oceanospirillaceae bacterium]|uniref:EVE domain-containing protein n=1 Tax=unclassified Thalassolituus TaxID=2624967 RepID=UPI000C607B8A|nr:MULTISPECIES: EVE domain-containing protein [unclassified Thalassolituus]MAS25494.1 EVE domain-containing protein [Oceanospirillaceae bacterium]MAY00032.1 EVE domain-containing protein [Oceanospirillaceae bacterium]MBL36279.1 EVE domain-containing protein [Oceanospirillaceae bacterium]MBS53796.1 EVE domain-containing protein [Oceanospirillaceae bacterium]|tara:strand:+ start:414 stop:878 length:465 start_codon:yes stop_codon:yes gene_type:complete
MNYWLLKSEPSAFGYEDLERAPDRRTLWDGVRNYQARNILRDDITVGDLAFFYHSACKEPAIVGICRVTRTGIADPSAFDPASDYYDPASDGENPKWITIEVEAVSALRPIIKLKDMRQDSALKDMVLLNRSRLSVQPVSETEWHHIMAQTKAV